MILGNYIQHYWQSWTSRRNQAGNPQMLTSNNLYILPSGFGWVFGFLLLTLFTGAINYQISSIFLMTFLMAVMGLVSAWEAHANLKEISLQLLTCEDTEQGAPLVLQYSINAPNKARFAVQLHYGKHSDIHFDLIPQEGLTFHIKIATSERGYFSLPKMVISSAYPFGIFRVWGYATFDTHYYVYPKPTSPGYWPKSLVQQYSATNRVKGQEDIEDLKHITHPWMQPNRIAWKLAAKEQGWYLKMTYDEEDHVWLFSLKDISHGDLETKLQYLSYWLLEAEARGARYGLNLGNKVLALGQGPQHLKQALRILASY